jgi:tetratricopeptide (TPR) repeat protein
MRINSFPTLAIIIACIIYTLLSFAGEGIPTKKLKKIEVTAAEGKIEKAEKQLEKLLQKYPHDGKGWDLLSGIRYKAWEESKQSDLFFKEITIQVKDSAGNLKAGTNDSLAQTLANLFKSVKISDGPYHKLIYTTRKATLLSDNAETSALLFRTHVLDIPVDTAISDTAHAVFIKAEEYFFQENYEKAARLYKDALALDSNYYQAALYLGDAYYFMGDYPRAIDAFVTAKHRGPFLIEPRKFLCDAYLKNGAYELALQEAVLAMLVLPEPSMEERLKIAAQKLNLTWTVSFTPRGVFPNIFRLPLQYKMNRMNYSDPFPLVAKGPWLHYEMAKNKLDKYCDEKGIVVNKNPLTNGDYLEVFSWEEMLKNSNDPLLNQARQMQQDGYLDCYVFITCFHFDLLEQYKDFAAKNEQKIKTYFRRYMK